MWETILGGVTGLIGSAVTAIFNYKTKKLDLEREIETKKLDIQLAEKEHEFALKTAEIQAAAETEKAAEATLQASYAHDRASYFTPFSGVIEKYPLLGIPFAIFLCPGGPPERPDKAFHDHLPRGTGHHHVLAGGRHAPGPGV